jgi:hypothetical protein
MNSRLGLNYQIYIGAIDSFEVKRNNQVHQSFSSTLFYRLVAPRDLTYNFTGTNSQLGQPEFSIGTSASEECSSSSFFSRTFVYRLCIASLAECMTPSRYDAAEMTAFYTAMAPIYAVIICRAFGVAGGAFEGHSDCKVSSHLSQGFVIFCF